MAEIVQTFTARDGDVARALQRMQRETEKLREKLAATADTSRKKSHAAVAGAKEESSAFAGVNGWLGAQVGSLGSMVLALGTVATAVAVAKHQYTLWHADIEKVAGAHEKLSTALLGSLAGLGVVGEADPALKFIEQLPGATREEGIKAFTAVGEAGSFDLEQRKALTAEVVKVAATGQDVGKFATLAGQMYDVLKDTKTAKDTANLAAGAASMIRGGDASILQNQASMRAMMKLVGTGAVGDVEQVEALLINAANANMKPGPLLEQIAAKIETPMKFNRQARTKEEHLVNQFAQADEATRAKMLLSQGPEFAGISEAVLGTGKGQSLALLDPAAIAATRQKLIDAQTNDFLGQQQAKLAESEIGREQLDRRDAIVRADKGEGARASRAEEFAIAEKRIQAVLEEQDANWFQRSVALLNRKSAEVITGALHSAGVLEEDDIAKHTQMIVTAGQYATLSPNVGNAMLADIDRASAEDHRRLQENTDALRANTEEMRRQQGLGAQPAAAPFPPRPVNLNGNQE